MSEAPCPRCFADPGVVCRSPFCAALKPLPPMQQQQAAKPASVYSPIPMGGDDGKKRAIVVRDIQVRSARINFPNHHILTMGGCLAGWRFDEIAVLVAPQNEREMQWLQQDLLMRLNPGSSVHYFF